MEGAEYPKALYRDGGPDLIWGQPVATTIAASPDHEVELIAKGWRKHPIADPVSRRTRQKEQ